MLMVQSTHPVLQRIRPHRRKSHLKIERMRPCRQLRLQRRKTALFCQSNQDAKRKRLMHHRLADVQNYDGVPREGTRQLARQPGPVVPGEMNKNGPAEIWGRHTLSSIKERRFPPVRPTALSDGGSTI